MRDPHFPLVYEYICVQAKKKTSQLVSTTAGKKYAYHLNFITGCYLIFVVHTHSQHHFI